MTKVNRAECTSSQCSLQHRCIYSPQISNLFEKTSKQFNIKKLPGGHGTAADVWHSVLLPVWPSLTGTIRTPLVLRFLIYWPVFHVGNVQHQFSGWRAPILIQTLDNTEYFLLLRKILQLQDKFYFHRIISSSSWPWPAEAYFLKLTFHWT